MMDINEFLKFKKSKRNFLKSADLIDQIELYQFLENLNFDSKFFLESVNSFSRLKGSK